MNLYEVIRWGNDADDPFRGGPNGDDTCFLVRADTHEEAASLADATLANTRSTQIVSWAQAVYLLGVDTGTGTDARILRGPYLQHAYLHGWRCWYRETRDAPWEARRD
ncbi:MAG TPA: hypothetical protein VLC08_07850 [Chitinolyticbacter sp.]|nr:hypothetical protein [Chitinolyticbacter sp.]